MTTYVQCSQTHNANMFCTFSCHFCRRKKSHVALTFEIFRIQDFCIKITDRAIIKFLQESDIDMKTRLIFYQTTGIRFVMHRFFKTRAIPFHGDRRNPF